MSAAQDYPVGTVAKAITYGEERLVVRDRVQRREWYVPEGAGPAALEFVSDGALTDLRLMLVVDPDDRQVAVRIAQAAATAAGVDPGVDIHDVIRAVAHAMRSLVTPKPPEPQGLGAVVEDKRGLKWVRVNERMKAEWRPADAASVGSFRRYNDIDAVRVLSEGAIA